MIFANNKNKNIFEGNTRNPENMFWKYDPENKKG